MKKIILLSLFIASVFIVKSAFADGDRLTIDNFVDGANNAKFNCSEFASSVSKFSKSDLEQKKIVAQELKAKGVNIVDTKKEFLALAKNEQETTAIWENIRLNSISGCATVSTPFSRLRADGSSVTPAASGSASSAAGSSTPIDKCTVKDNKVSTAINNYPASITNHSAYYDKWNEKNWRCSIVEISISKPSDVQAQVEKYLTANVEGAKIVNSKSEFDALSPDDQKKAIIASSLKCNCQGPNSIDYKGLKFKDGNKILPRDDTSYEKNNPGGMQIGGFDPKTGSVPGDSSSCAGGSCENPLGADTAKIDFAKPDEDGRCIKFENRNFCFYDKTAQGKYKAEGDSGPVHSEIKTIADMVQSGISKSKDQKGEVPLVIITSAQFMREMMGMSQNAQGIGALTCLGEDDSICSKALDTAIGGIKNIKSYYPSGSPYFIIFPVLTGESTIKMMSQHEWAHVYDTVSSFKESYETVTQNPKYIFNQFSSSALEKAKTQDTSAYPRCVYTAMSAASGDVTNIVSSEMELFAYSYTIKNGTLTMSGSGECQTKAQEIVNEHSKLQK